MFSAKYLVEFHKQISVLNCAYSSTAKKRVQIIIIIKRKHDDNPGVLHCVHALHYQYYTHIPIIFHTRNFNFI